MILRNKLMEQTIKQQIQILFIQQDNNLMQSDKKTKIQSFLSLTSSLSALQMSKKQILKPLQLSDIIVVMVQQQLSVDKTNEYKSFLTKNRKGTINLDKNQQLIKPILMDIPEFAKKQWGFTQLLKYHIDKKTFNKQQDIQLYQKKLLEIENQFTNSLDKYKYQLEQGKNYIEEIQTNVNNLYQTTIISKHHINSTNQKIHQFSKKIFTNIKKQQNISKTIAIAKAWSKSNISKVLSQNINNIQTLDINILMKQIDNCSKQIKLQGNNKELQNFDKVLKVIQDRRNLVIQKIQKNMLFSIIGFTDQYKYQKTYHQYNDLLQSLAWSNQQKFKEYHQLQKNNLQIMIQDNIDHIYWNSLEQVSTVNNIELLREQTYTAFFSKLVQNYNSYLIKWHKVTSFHVNSNTPHKDNFMKMLQDVANKIIKKVFHLVKYSQKFFSVSFCQKIKLILEIDKLIQFIHQWTSKRDISLFQVLKQKFKAEIQNFRKQTNGFIKILFVQQFSQDSLKPKIKRKSSGDQKQQKNLCSPYRIIKILIQQHSSQSKIAQISKLRQIAKTKLFSQNFESLAPNSKEQPAETQRIKDSSKRFKQKIKQLAQQTFDLQISKNFIKAILQYCQRQQILPFGHLEYILQHFQFLILLIFKVCVHEETKTKMIQDFSQKAFLKLKDVQIGIDKNPSDEHLLNILAKMRQSFIMRRNYLELHHFLSEEIDNKFDNLIISGFVNINKLYQNPNENAQMLNSYHMKLSKLIEQLLKISRWLINNQSEFSHYEKFSKKLQYLPTVLIQLGFLYFQQYNSLLYHKYLQTIEPLMKNLKWKIQKFNQQTTLSFREYKINILQIYRSSTLNIGIKDKQLHEQLTNKQLQVFYKALLYLYCKIDKINDNGRQVLRLDVIEISKILQQVGYNPGSWAVWFQKFIQSTMERSIKSILQKIEQLGIVYPIYCWKSHLLWIVNNLSTKQKKQYTTHLLRIYVDQLKQLPQF